MTFSHPHFAEPRWLWLAMLGPLVLLALQQYSAWARKRQLAQIAAPHFLDELTRSHSPIRRGLKNALLVVAVAVVGLALARPQWGEQESPEGESVAHKNETFGIGSAFPRWWLIDGVGRHLEFSRARRGFSRSTVCREFSTVECVG